jgi:hypothetical protein
MEGTYLRGTCLVTDNSIRLEGEHHSRFAAGCPTISGAVDGK